MWEAEKGAETEPMLSRGDQLSQFTEPERLPRMFSAKSRKAPDAPEHVGQSP